MSSSRLVRAVCAVWFASAWLAATACGPREAARDLRPAGQSVDGQATPVETPRPVANRPRIVALGDSLTAGLGLRPDWAYPAVLQQRVDAAGLNFEVVNAGVSGDTSAGGLRRLDLALEGDVRVLIVALGANDGLRGLAPAQLRMNLGQIIETAQARDVAVVLAGMQAPPNFGSVYVAEFRQVFPDLAKQYHTALVPFLLEGVAGVGSLNQSDGIHPNAEGALLVADTVWGVLRPVLENASPRRRVERNPAS